MKPAVVKKMISARCGVGGYHCSCCGPRSHEAKKLLSRRIRRVVKHAQRVSLDGK